MAEDKEKKVNSLEKPKKKGLIILGISIIIICLLLICIEVNSMNKPQTKPENTNQIENVEDVKQNIEIAEDIKPIMYLYPTETTEVTVTLGKPENITHSYPEYKDGWKVIAKTNGSLVDSDSGKNLYSLYWEEINTIKPKMTEGFVIKGENTSELLEEKLSILGLSEREANELIIYWLPQLEINKYNFIRFMTMEEIQENMPINIEPKPDTLIRIVMEWKGLDDYIDIPEQQLKTINRTGFVVVECGGTKIK